MNFTPGQKLNLERNPIYNGSVTNAKLQETTREIARVEYHDNGRISLKFKGSKLWYSTRESSEWIQSKNMKYRNLNWTA